MSPARSLTVRPIRPEDDPHVEHVIRTVMTEQGASGAGFAIQDAEVRAMSAAYADDRTGYLVVELQGRVVGGAGFGPLAGGDESVCELRKMYLLPEARGAGIGRRLLGLILEQAREAGFTECYLETLGTMEVARHLYESVGFRKLEAPMGCTGHSGCNTWYARKL